MTRFRQLANRTAGFLFGERAQFEVIAPVLLLLASAAVWAFVEVADEVIEGDSHAWDRRILLAMRTAGDTNDPLGPPWFEELMRDVTAFGGVAAITSLTAFVVVYLALDGRRALATFVGVAVGSGVGISSLLKVSFARPRPALVAHGSHVGTASFPSGHSMVAAVAFLTLGLLFARTRGRRRLQVLVVAVALLLTVAVGTSRVYLGVHWPSDVLAGWCAGAFWALLCSFVAWRLRL